MKAIRHIFFIALFHSLGGSFMVSAQEKNTFVNEFAVSLNASTSVSSNFKSRLGFGLGCYHLFRKNHKTNFVIGLEYNYVSKFNYLGDFSHFSNYTNVTYRFHYLSLPFQTRINFGRKTKFFIEPGVFVDLGIISQMKGEYSFAYPVSDTIYKHGTKKVNEFYQGNVNAGFSLSIGVKIPTNKINLILKAEYKFGLIGYLLKQNDLLGYVRLSFAIGLKLRTNHHSVKYEK